MADSFSAWRCVGCGRVEAPQTCIGVCQDRRVELVFADEHRDTERALAQATRERDALASLVRRLAFSVPRGDAWERSYRSLQQQARALLAPADAGGRAGSGAREPARESPAKAGAASDAHE